VKVFVLAGGLGTRLAGAIGDRPKVLAPVGGRAFLDVMIDRLVAGGVTKIVLLLGHLHEQVERHIAEKKWPGVEITCVVEPAPLGTAGALKNAAAHVDGTAILMNGDTFVAFDPAALLAAHRAARAAVTIAVRDVPDSGRYGAVDAGPDGRVRAFREKDPARGAGTINAGVYVFEPSVLARIAAGRAVSLETEVLPALLAAGEPVHAALGVTDFIDIGTPESWRELDKKMGSKSGLDKLITGSIQGSIDVKQGLFALAPQITRAAELMVEAYRGGGKAIFFGNGGSAADAQHLAAEMECRYAFDRRPLPALALHANSSSVTAIANDYSYQDVFVRPLRAHGKPGDVAIAISTSGTSKNVLAAARIVRELGVKLIGLTGENGGPLSEHADVVIAVPSRVTARIQECHILIGHILCEWVEAALCGRDAAS
jgi:phosphoheptose isomerase/UTP-glucose-1-phosphate uridylyltransferase